MTKPLIAEFSDADSLISAAVRLKREGHQLLDAFTPFRLPELDSILIVKPSRIRLSMLVGGLAMAAFFYFLQWYSSVIDYPLNTGGRPLNSWPVFLLVPFEVGMLAAALSGFAAFLWTCRLPRLYHPIFDTTDFARATQDRFFLLAAQTGKEERSASLRKLLKHSGAVAVREQGS
ncbi:hypothetical protein Nham_4185 (plasmid) [Nitrobacter hamburgensis X14]|uniref:Quinol:cytochrome c oxidoreductase membrane protein n=1 Tax=Nitrobacter hamburgensis (strain DSM 10229 / NCIMB 13809 / X14) TaxID=323097 RepID=Q1QG39_NITHX|nr:DUF3341 domain-containing protein [Nitrobacter hamburgensis]ABE64808.1 hypothetical protein Nham_4185 [Nitrobacter hamburgensis X14]